MIRPKAPNLFFLISSERHVLSTRGINAIDPQEEGGGGCLILFMIHHSFMI